MKTVVLVYSTRERANVKFREMLNFLGDEITRSTHMPMIIELGKTQYKFINMDTIEQLRGIRINRVIIDEFESLTEEQLWDDACGSCIWWHNIKQTFRS